VLDRALEHVAKSWHGAAIHVEKEYQADLPLVALDESLCEQAFVNVVQNAYDAMGASGGRLRVKITSSQMSERRGVEVRIVDDGPGIPPGLREQIFNPFVTTKKDGVGLGLSIVSKIMDGHHGSIRVEDTSGGGGMQKTGACFVVFFPVAEDGKRPVAESAHL
jgi:nitrogen-specific signal transduction histidine kinase